MSHLKEIFLISLLCLNVLSLESDKKCDYLFNSNFICFDITLLQVLDKAPSNITAIKISESKLYNIPGYAFARFGNTLLLLDLHRSHINVIETNAFNGLPVLEKLELWGNNLIRVSADWFGYPGNLKHLDLSFNQISDVTDINFFYKLNRLESLYLDNNKLMTIDYTLFSAMPYLRNVQIGNNPWQWNYRVLLMWQLKNQMAANDEIWDNWEWISYSTQKCKDEGHDFFQGSKILYCTFENILDFLITQMKTLNNSSVINLQPIYSEYISKAFKMTQCFKNSIRIENSEAIMTAVKASLNKVLLMDQTQNFHVY